MWRSHELQGAKKRPNPQQSPAESRSAVRPSPMLHKHLSSPERQTERSAHGKPHQPRLAAIAPILS